MLVTFFNFQKINGWVTPQKKDGSELPSFNLTSNWLISEDEIRDTTSFFPMSLVLIKSKPKHHFLKTIIRGRTGWFVK